MVVLDTNAFYYAAGISSCTYSVEKLQKLIDENDAFLSSTSLFEFMIKYRNNIDTIHKGGEYLVDNGIRVVGNVLNPLPKDFTGDISGITEKEYEVLCNEMLQNKIDVEARFISILLDICLLSAIRFSNSINKTEHTTDLPLEILKKISRLLARLNLGLCVDVFTEGYKSDDCENYVRNNFYKILAYELEKTLPLVDYARKISNPDDFQDMEKWISLEDFNKETTKLRTKMQSKTSTSFLQRLAIDYWKLNNDPELRKLINDMISVIGKKIGLQALQDYFYDTMSDVMTKGAAIWKNDLLDAIILCNVRDDNILITYDNKVIKRMEKRRLEYPLYSKSLKVIYELKGV